MFKNKPTFLICLLLVGCSTARHHFTRVDVEATDSKANSVTTPVEETLFVNAKHQQTPNEIQSKTSNDLIADQGESPAHSDQMNAAKQSEEVVQVEVPIETAESAESDSESATDSLMEVNSQRIAFDQEENNQQDQQPDQYTLVKYFENQVDPAESNFVHDVGLLSDETSALSVNTDKQLPPPLTAPPENAELAPIPMPFVPDRKSEQEIPLDLDLEDVIGSVYRSYPMLESALFSRNIATGEIVEARGAFDLKLKAATENDPIGFYQNYRQSIGLMQPTLNGGELFGGYRVGNGFFEPWYLERQTNEGGEFKAGFMLPLAQDRNIDERRAELWRSQYGRQLIESDIQAQVIGFVLESSYAYWDWVAAGQKYKIFERILKLTEDRMQQIQRRVDVDLVPQFDLIDNQRLVAERKAKLAESERKLKLTAVKLSMYYRDFDGNPVVPDNSQLPEFPELDPIDEGQFYIDSDLALQLRPEITLYNLYRRQLQVDFAEASNGLRPTLDAMMTASQDFGQPTSSKNDKGEFELEASIFFDVPVQRRKARGKIQQVQGKIAQLTAKRRLVENKIVADVQMAYASLITAYNQAVQASQAVEFADDLARRERRNYDEDLSDLLKVIIREEYAIQSAEKAVDAKLEFFRARAEYRAAMGQDQAP